MFSEERRKRSVRIVVFIATYMFGVCETWSLTMREERRLRIFVNRVLREIFGPKKEQRGGENYGMMRLMICTRRQILFM
jgi:hypothetical protein